MEARPRLTKLRTETRQPDEDLRLGCPDKPDKVVWWWASFGPTRNKTGGPVPWSLNSLCKHPRTINSNANSRFCIIQIGLIGVEILKQELTFLDWTGHHARQIQTGQFLNSQRVQEEEGIKAAASELETIWWRSLQHLFEVTSSEGSIPWKRASSATCTSVQ